MSAYAWNRRRINRIRVREDLRDLNGGGGLTAILARRENWAWRKGFLRERGWLRVVEKPGLWTKQHESGAQLYVSTLK